MTRNIFDTITKPDFITRRGIQKVGADPISAALMAITGTATLSAAVGKIVLGLALTALSRRKQVGTTSAGIKTEASTTGGVTPQSFVLGRYATAGNHIAPAMSTKQHGNTPNAFLTYVMDISDLPIHNLSRVVVDGEFVPLDPTPDADGFLKGSGRLDDVFWVKFYDGSQTLADPWLVSEFGSYPHRPWTDEMKGLGVAYAILKFRYDRAKYNGIPSVKFEAEGIPLYDPRNDSSVGGSGAQRWDDPSTWQYTDNPAVMIYNILRGIPLPDGSVYGIGATADEVPLSHAVAAMNICEMSRAGETVPQYRAGYEVKIGSSNDGGEDPLTVIDELLKSCDGDVAEVGGRWFLRAGGPGLPVMTITDGDIVVNRPQDLDPFPGLSETVNVLHATAPSPDELWEEKDAPSRINTAAIAEDGQRLSSQIMLPAVPYRKQVQQLMKSWLADARRFSRHNITLMPHALNLTPLDVIEWTSERNQYLQKLFEVDQVAISSTSLAVTCAIREVDPDAGRWEAGDELPEDLTPPVVVEPAPEVLPGFTVSAIQILDKNGVSRRPAIKIEWVTDLDDVTSIVFKVRDKTTGQVVTTGTTADVEDGVEIVTAGILPLTEYEVQAKMKAARETLWSQWVTVTTPAAELITADDLPTDVLDDIKDAQDAAAAASTEAAQALAEAALAEAIAQGVADDVDGFQADFKAVTVNTEGGGIAGFKAVSWTNPDGTGNAVLQLLGKVIVEQTLATNRLVVGIGKNILENPDFVNGGIGFGAEMVDPIGMGGKVSIRADGDYSTTFYPTLRIQSFVGVAGSGYVAVKFAPPKNASANLFFGYPVKGNGFYEFSCAVFLRRVRAQVQLKFYDKNGQGVGTTNLYTRSTTGVDNFESNRPQSWPRVGGIAQAPSNAAYCVPYVMINQNTAAGSNNDMYVFQPMLSETQSADNALSPYSPGGTTLVDGNRIVTGSVVADAIAAGAITADKIAANAITTDKLRVVSFLDMSAQGTGFRMGKQDITDYENDGAYLGRTDIDGNTGFGFFVGRKDGSSEEYVRISSDDGLHIKNANFLLGTGVGNLTNITNSQTFNFPPGTKTFSFSAVGGGGGGAGGGAGGGGLGGAGGDGGQTRIVLKNGSTTVKTWTIPGGDGGSPGGSRFPSPSEMDPNGTGGAGGLGAPRTGDDDAGKDGGAGVKSYPLSVNSYDISGLANPSLQITVGKGGTKGNGGLSAGDGEPGNDGIVKLTTKGTGETIAGPVGRDKAASGTMSLTSGGDTHFPAFGAFGIWVLWNVPENTQFEIDLNGTMQTIQGGSGTIIAGRKRPWVRNSPATKTINYLFFPTGTK